MLNHRSQMPNCYLSIHVCHPAGLYARTSDGVTVCSNQQGMWLPVHACQDNECGGMGGLPVTLTLLEWIRYISDLRWVYVNCLSWKRLDRSLCPAMGNSLSPFFLPCRCYCVCLPWAVPFVLGLVHSLLSSSAPPLTGSILGPQTLYSQSATSSSRRLKALRSGLWTQIILNEMMTCSSLLSSHRMNYIM